MRSLLKTVAKTSRTLGGSVAAVMLSGMLMSSPAMADIATTYENSCAACHDSGAPGAIKKGDSAGWAKPKQQKGMPALVSSVKNGMIQMPAGGLCDECSDDDYRQLIDYMSQ